MTKNSCCPTKKSTPDYLLWVSFIFSALFYLYYYFLGASQDYPAWLNTFSLSVFDLINSMWWGIALGIVMLALLSKVPREFVVALLGTHKSGLGSILRATGAGVLLDLCNHGILMVGAKLYERGASIGQVMAFLVASPWNSFSLTLILVALIGLPWTLAFIGFSLLIAIITGLIFDNLVSKKILPENPNQITLPEDFRFWREAKANIKNTKFTPNFLLSMLVSGFKDSRMVLRWVLFGVLLAGLIRTFVSTEHFQTYFGPSLIGLFLTVIAATIIEVCSEGSTPIAADLLTRAAAPGNSFAFLMTGVSTDYTEIMVLKSVTKSWKIALFLPLVTVPQVIFISWLINLFSV